MRHATTALLLSLAAALPAADPTRDVNGLSVTFDALEYTSEHFDMGLASGSWNTSQRYEADFLAQLSDQRVGPVGGGYVFYEERDWRGEARASADYSCWGFGLQGGAAIQLLKPEQKTRLSLVPMLRGGIGFQDLTVNNLPVAGVGGVQTYSLTAGSGRVEVAAGLDLRLVVARRLEIVFGGGADYWSAADVYVTAGTGGAGVGVVGNSYAFHGTDSFLRFGLGVRL
jgi:hypothetical protein